MIKMNINAALFEASHCFNFPMVARNNRGVLIEAMSRCDHGSLAPEIQKQLELGRLLDRLRRKLAKHCYQVGLSSGNTSYTKFNWYAILFW